MWLSSRIGKGLAVPPVDGVFIKGCPREQRPGSLGQGNRTCMFDGCTQTQGDSDYASIDVTGDQTQDLIRKGKKMMATVLLSVQPLCLHSVFLSAPSVHGIAVFLCLWVKLLLFFPGDIYFCQKHLLSLDSNATEASWALFFPCLF